MADCDHKSRESSTTEVKMRDGWVPSTTYIRCADCGAGLGIKTRAAAFQADHVPRRANPWVPMCGRCGDTGSVKTASGEDWPCPACNGGTTDSPLPHQQPGETQMDRKPDGDA